MEILLSLLLAATTAAPVLAQPATSVSAGQPRPAPTFYALKSRSAAAYEAKRYREAGQLYEQAFAVPGARPAGGDYYDAACDWALAGDAARAFAYLDQATAAGWLNLPHLKEDTDLTGLHADPRWPALLTRMQAASARAEAKQNVALKRELEEIFALDQTARRQAADLDRRLGPKAPGLDSLWRLVEAADARNLPRVTAMIDRYGWPGKTLVGAQGSTTAFLVIQHSNLATMQKYLPVMRQAADRGELENSALALLEDRVLMYQGQPQLYGSQLRRNATSGRMEFAPIADPGHVDARRARMGLGPLADYARPYGAEAPPQQP